MKKILLTASALATAAALSTAAQAADMAPAPSAYDWSGFYFGLNAGAAMNNSDVDHDVTYEGERYNELLDQIEGDQTVFTGGAMLGYNYQIDQIVLGVEADINYAGFGDDVSRDRDLGVVGSFDNVTSSSDFSFDANWFGTLRGRLGFAADNLLFYGTGGLAYGHMSADGSLELEGDFTGTNPATPASIKWDGSTDSTNWGWTIGAGMEYGIDNWSLGVEYLYVDLGSAEWDGDRRVSDIRLQPIADAADLKGSVDYQFSVVRATAKIRF